MKRSLKYLLIGLAAVIITITIQFFPEPDEKEQEVDIFGYTVTLGAPQEFNLLFGGHNSYLYLTEKNQETGEKIDRIVTSFPTLGDFQGGFWRNGGTKTSNSNRAEFPTGIYLQWYSLFEKQGWKIRFDFDPIFMEKLKHHCFRNVNRGAQVCMIDRRNFGQNYILGSFNFSIYAMPSGLAYVYMSGGGETYLLGELQAEPTDINFESYKITLGSRLNETGDEVFNRRLSYQTEEFQKAYHDGTLSFSTEKWERRMKRYDWELVGNSFYKVKGPFNAVYTNAEMYNIYQDGKNTFRDRHAPPNHLTVYLEGTELSPNPGVVKRVRFKFDDDEIMKSFEIMSALDPDVKLQLQLDLSADFTGHRLFLKNGDKIRRIESTMFYIEDIPELYKPVIEDPNYKMPSVD
ncbi:hypothetical protein WMO13_04205 [Ignatzschineria larvae DSM 13226]|uniref:DUF2931 family protein n=1 Tax=Ignatzschineria larvae DSM 13226 TaxID=1111732 RepID=A0ABZ3C286_9GAMM